MADPHQIPAITADQMREVDHQAFDRCGVPGISLMEVAGRAVAEETRLMLGGDPRGKRVVVLAGPGGNGGDGYVAARHLHGWGAVVAVWTSHPPDHTSGATATNREAWECLGPIMELSASNGEVTLPAADIVIDALLGFGVGGAPHGDTARLIRATNDASAQVLAVDLPSGLDADTGTPYSPCIRAARTLTLGLPKVGMFAPAARDVCGEIVVADIGMPREAYEAAGITVPPIFARGSRIPLG